MIIKLFIFLINFLMIQIWILICRLFFFFFWSFIYYLAFVRRVAVLLLPYVDLSLVLTWNVFFFFFHFGIFVVLISEFCVMFCLVVGKMEGKEFDLSIERIWCRGLGSYNLSVLIALSSSLLFVHIHVWFVLFIWIFMR